MAMIELRPTLAGIVLAASVALAGTPAAWALQIGDEAVPQGGVSAEARVLGRAPVIADCAPATNPRHRCFRIFLRIMPKSRSELKVAYIRTHRTDYMYETTAFVENGRRCAGASLGGLPHARRRFDEVQWEDQPFSVTSAKPGTLLIDYECDGDLVAGDSVTAQITLAIDPDGRGPQMARYVFTGPLRGR
jgi:hypothetical protein